MLDKEFVTTPRKVIQVFLLLLIGLVVIAANVDKHNSQRHFHGNSGLNADTVSKKVYELESELYKIIDDNRLCYIIGAYTILNQQETLPTIENVAAFVIICECWYPDIIMAQYQLESAKGTSQLAKKNKNLFGMSKAFTRKSVRCRSFDSQGYAIYNNWQLSVVDRIYWEEHVFKNVKPTKAQYLERIKKIYSKDSQYIEKIKKIAKDYEYLYDYMEERDWDEL